MADLKVNGNYIYNNRSQQIGRVNGNYIYNAQGNTIGRVNGNYIYNDRGQQVGTLADFQHSVIMAAIHMLFRNC